MAKKNAFDKYMEIGADPQRVLTEAEIMRGLRGVLHRMDPVCFGTRTPEAAAIYARMDALNKVYEDNPRRITPEHTAKGLDWFASMKRADGSWRKTAQAECFPDYAREILARFDHFRFYGLEDIATNYRRFYVPMYEVVGKDGSSFLYHGRSWQNGGGWETYRRGDYYATRAAA